MNHKAMKGAAALAEMISCIGVESEDDHRIARILVDNELDLRELLNFVLPILARVT